MTRPTCTFCLASTSSLTSAAAVVKRSGLFCRHAAKNNPVARWLLPVPHSPMRTMGSLRSMYPPSASSRIFAAGICGAWMKSNSPSVLMRASGNSSTPRFHITAKRGVVSRRLRFPVVMQSRNHGPHQFRRIVIQFN